jgi:hypothetical protein
MISDITKVQDFGLQLMVSCMIIVQFVIMKSEA